MIKIFNNIRKPTGKYLVPLTALFLLGLYFFVPAMEKYIKNQKIAEFKSNNQAINDLEVQSYLIDMNKTQGVKLRLPKSSLNVLNPVSYDLSQYSSDIKFITESKGDITQSAGLPKSKFNIFCFGHSSKIIGVAEGSSDTGCLKYYTALSVEINKILGPNTLNAYYVQTNYREQFKSTFDGYIKSSINSIGGARYFDHLIDANLLEPSYNFNTLVPYGNAKSIHDFYIYDLKNELVSTASKPYNYANPTKTGFTVITDSNLDIIQSYLFAKEYGSGFYCRESYKSKKGFASKANPLLISRAIYKSLTKSEKNFRPDDRVVSCDPAVADLKVPGYEQRIINERAIKDSFKILEMIGNREKNKKEFLKKADKVFDLFIGD